MQTGLNQIGTEQLRADIPKTTELMRWPTLNTLLKVLSPELADYWVLVAYSVVIGIIGLAVPIAVQSYVNTVAFGSLFQPIVALAVFLLVVLGFSAVFQALNLAVIEILHRRLLVRFCGRFVSLLPKLAKGTQRDSLHLSNKFFEVAYFQKILTSLLVEGFSLLLQTLTGLLLLAFYHPALLALDIFILISTFLAFYSFGSKGTSYAIAESHQRYALAEWFQDLALSSTSFRAPSNLSYARGKTDRMTTELLNLREKAFFFPFIQYAGCLAIYAIGSAGLLGVGGYLVMKEQLTLGQLIAAEIVLTAILASIAKFGGKLGSYYDILASGEKMAYVLLEPPEDREFEDSFVEQTPALRLKLNSFQGITAEFSGGSVSQILAPPGCGEELAQILLGDRLVPAGQISWNGVDLELIARGQRTRSLSLICGPKLIPGTVLENLTFGLGACDPAEIENAVRISGTLETITALPKGYHTEVYPNDSTLSYETRLRLTIARAILEKPRILIIAEFPYLASGPLAEDLVKEMRRALPEAIIIFFGEKPLPFIDSRSVVGRGHS